MHKVPEITHHDHNDNESTRIVNGTGDVGSCKLNAAPLVLLVRISHTVY